MYMICPQGNREWLPALSVCASHSDLYTKNAIWWEKKKRANKQNRKSEIWPSSPQLGDQGWHEQWVINYIDSMHLFFFDEWLYLYGLLPNKNMNPF